MHKLFIQDYIYNMKERKEITGVSYKLTSVLVEVGLVLTVKALLFCGQT